MIGLDALIGLAAAILAGLWLGLFIRLRRSGRQPESSLVFMGVVVAALVAFGRFEALALLPELADQPGNLALYYLPDPTMADYLPRMLEIAALWGFFAVARYVTAKAQQKLVSSPTGPLE